MSPELTGLSAMRRVGVAAFPPKRGWEGKNFSGATNLAESTALLRRLAGFAPSALRGEVQAGGSAASMSGQLAGDSGPAHPPARGKAHHRQAGQRHGPAGGFGDGREHEAHAHVLPTVCCGGGNRGLRSATSIV